MFRAISIMMTLAFVSFGAVWAAACDKSSGVGGYHTILKEGDNEVPWHWPVAEEITYPVRPLIPWGSRCAGVKAEVEPWEEIALDGWCGSDGTRPKLSDRVDPQGLTVHPCADPSLEGWRLIACGEPGR